MDKKLRIRQVGKFEWEYYDTMLQSWQMMDEEPAKYIQSLERAVESWKKEEKLWNEAELNYKTENQKLREAFLDQRKAWLHMQDEEILKENDPLTDERYVELTVLGDELNQSK